MITNLTVYRPYPRLRRTHPVTSSYKCHRNWNDRRGKSFPRLRNLRWEGARPGWEVRTDPAARLVCQRNTGFIA
ncbi:hypothetical protein GCM10009727_23380 [Actinomadura napierensis]|uniref:Uncharacterized protein n=1 Tax=Actinomadura napierensis TaxID=267854 RepID=A0ABN2YR87_9ACTN